MPKKIIDLDALTEFKAKCDLAYSGGGASLPTGGTTGQVLAKKSNADDDVEWSDYATQMVSNGRLIKINANPSSYTTTTGGFRPSYRVSRSAFTINTTNISDPQIGDLVYYSSYYYYIGYVDTNYVYLSARVSIVGPAGTRGTDGKNGSVYASSVAPSGSGPWIFTASNLSPTYSSQTTTNFLIYYGGYFYAATSASTTTITCNSRYLIPTDTPSTLAGLTDTLISSPSDGQTLVWNATAQAWKNSDVRGGGGLVIPLDYSYSALAASSGATVYLLQSAPTISKLDIVNALSAGGAINFAFNSYGMFNGEAALIGYEEYSNNFGTYQRALAVLTDGSSEKTFIVDFNWDYQDNIQNLVFTALNSGGGGGSGFGISTPVAYLDYFNGDVQNTTIDSGLVIVASTTNPISASNFVLECSSGNTVAISAMAYAIIDSHSNRYNSFDAYIQSNPQAQDQCSLVVWYVTTGTTIWKTTIPLTVNDVTSSSIELMGDQQGQAQSIQANFIGD